MEKAGPGTKRRCGPLSTPLSERAIVSLSEEGKNFYPFFEGISTPSFGRDPSAAAGRNNDQDYENGQQQRAYERAVREAKRECVVYKTAMDEATTDGARAAFQEDFTRASVKLKRREARLAAWVEQTDGNREREREAVAGFDRSVSSRAVWANKKAGK